MSHEQDYDEYESELDDEIRAKQDAMADMASDEKSPQKQITAQDLLNATRMFVWGDYQAIIIGIADDSDPDYFTIYNPRGYDEESESIIGRPLPRMAFDKTLYVSRQMITAVYFPDADILGRYFKNITQSKIEALSVESNDIDSAVVATKTMQ
ncbi:MAG: hypothetical protein RSC93_02010 [Erysipelotrichaceae bacterium]